MATMIEAKPFVSRMSLEPLSKKTLSCFQKREIINRVSSIT